MFGPAGESVRSPLCGQCRKKGVEGCCPRVPSDHHLPEMPAAVISRGDLCKAGTVRAPHAGGKGPGSSTSPERGGATYGVWTGETFLHIRAAYAPRSNPN